MARNAWGNVVAARATTTSTTFQVHNTLTFTPAAGSKDHWLIPSGVLDVSSIAAGRPQGQFYNSTGAAELFKTNPVPRDTADKMVLGGISKWTSPPSPVSQAFQVRYNRTSTSLTIGMSESAIVAIEADAADEYVEALAETSSSAGSYVDKATLTVSGSGDFLILASGYCDGTATASGNIRLNVDGTIVAAAEPYGNFGAYGCWAAAYKATLSPGDVIKVQFSSTSGTAFCGNVRLLALKLDSFGSADVTQNASRQTTTSATYGAAVTQNITASAGVDYITLAAGNVDNSSITTSVRARQLRDGSGWGTTDREPGSTGWEMPYWSVYFGQYSAGSRDFKTEWNAESGTAGITNAIIAVLRPSVPTVDFVGVAGQGVAGAAGLPALGKIDVKAAAAIGAAAGAGHGAVVVLNSDVLAAVSPGVALADGAGAALVVDAVPAAGSGAAAAVGSGAVLSVDVVAGAGIGAGAADGQAAVVLVGSDMLAAPGFGAASADGSGVALLLDVAVSAGQGAASADGLAAAAVIDAVLSGGTGAAAADGLGPAVLTNRNFEETALPGDALASGQAASLTADQVGRPAIGGALGDGQPVAVSTDGVARPGMGAATGLGMSARMIADQILAASSGAAAAGGRPAVVLAERGVVVSPGVGAAIADGFLAGLTLDQVLQAAIGAALADGSLATLDVSAIDEILAEISFELAVSSQATFVPAVSGEVDITAAVSSQARFDAAVDAEVTIIPAVAGN